jgi:hypothetical protein
LSTKKYAGVSSGFLRTLCPEIEAELEFGLLGPSHIIDSCLVGEKKIVQNEVYPLHDMDAILKVRWWI